MPHLYFFHMTKDVLCVLCRAETGIFDVSSVPKGSVGRKFPLNGNRFIFVGEGIA